MARELLVRHVSIEFDILFYITGPNQARNKMAGSSSSLSVIYVATVHNVWFGLALNCKLLTD